MKRQAKEMTQFPDMSIQGPDFSDARSLVPNPRPNPISDLNRIVIQPTPTPKI